ncbi:MAG: LacI family DNA-binding transcriptional regulator [Bacillota bacterium]|nr:LacI family DNA-binding transcriptional regulator [Bacillota bacterium]
MPTLNDIASKLGISKGTVSKAINGADDISDALRKEVLETAVEMGYSRICVNKKDTKKLVIFIRNMEYLKEEDFGYDIVMGFKKMAVPAGYQVDIVELTKEIEEEYSYEEFMLANNYEGAFVLGFNLFDTWLANFETSHTPLVLFDNMVKGNPFVSCVGVDTIESMEQIISYLFELGHRKIGYLSSELGSYVYQQRHKAFLNTMIHYGLEHSSEYTGSDYDARRCILNHLPRMLELGCSAIVCSHDELAHALLAYCQEQDLRVPEDISVVGIDNLPLSATSNPPLTTIYQDKVQIGRAGYYALSSQFADVHIGTLSLHPQLIIRQSCTYKKEEC